MAYHPCKRSLSRGWMAALYEEKGAYPSWASFPASLNKTLWEIWEHPLVLDLTSVKTPDRCTSRTIGIIPGRSADAQLEGSGKVILVFKAKLFAYLLYFQ